ncbi:hypothetical protein HK102_004769 [Quaeritorhiza haematococci]|nr:hypothetical protein HK102_004769 [Quaeritorhiza haematococci]
MCREVRAQVAARDRQAASSGGQDISAVQFATMVAKKNLAHITVRIQSLDEGLKRAERERVGAAASGGSSSYRGLSGSIGGAGNGGDVALSKGELLRRQDLLANLKEDRDQINRLVNDHTAKQSRGGASDSMERAALLSMPTTSSSLSSNTSNAGPLSSSPSFPRSSSSVGRLSSRKFGITNPPRETEETRPLENAGLVQLQRTKMNDQDQVLESLLQVVQRQKQIGYAIGNELDLQNQMLEEVDETATRVAGHLKSTSRRLDRVRKG